MPAKNTMEEFFASFVSFNVLGDRVVNADSLGLV
jgi:hypothetical protein